MMNFNHLQKNSKVPRYIYILSYRQMLCIRKLGGDPIFFNTIDKNDSELVVNIKLRIEIRLEV